MYLQKCVIEYNKLSNSHEELWATGKGGVGDHLFHLGSIRLDFSRRGQKPDKTSTSSVTIATGLMGCHGRSSSGGGGVGGVVRESEEKHTFMHKHREAHT